MVAKPAPSAQAARAVSLADLFNDAKTSIPPTGLPARVEGGSEYVAYVSWRVTNCSQASDEAPAQLTFRTALGTPLSQPLSTEGGFGSILDPGRAFGLACPSAGDGHGDSSGAGWESHEGEDQGDITGE